MNNIKSSAATVTRVLFNAFLVFAMIALASLIGVGGAALWIYGRPMAARTAPVALHAPMAGSVAASDKQTFPQLTPLQTSDDAPVQLTPARHVPSESEIATFSGTPRYTYVSYNGGRQQAHLRVNTVLATSIPAPLAPVAAPFEEDAAPSNNVVDSPRVPSAQPKGLAPEVRVAASVMVRKAIAVDDDEIDTAPAGEFNVQSELSKSDDRPVLRAIPVTHSARSSRPSMFGASDDFGSFGRN